MTPEPTDLDPLLRADRAADAPFRDDELARIRAALAVTHADTGWRSRMRGMSSSARSSVASLAYLACAASVVFLAGPREDLSANLNLRGIFLLPVLAVVGSLALAVALRGLDQPPLSRRQQVGWLALLAVPPALGLVPEAWPGIRVGDAELAGLNSACFTVGLLVAAPVALIALLLERDDRPAPWRVALGGAAGGIAAFVALELHCAASNPWHLVCAHASEGLAVAAPAVLWAWWRARRSRA